MKSLTLLVVFVLCFTGTIFAQEGQTDASKKMQTEMKQSLGAIPPQFKVFPEHLHIAAWEMMKARQSPEAALPAKYSELIGLAVASQIPCTYCVYFHTEMAKMLGASQAEIQEAVASAAQTRFWSTVLNGANPDFKSTKIEIDKMLNHVKKQMKAAQTLKK